MLTASDEFKEAMKAPIKVMNAKAYFPSLEKSPNLFRSNYQEVWIGADSFVNSLADTWTTFIEVEPDSYYFIVRPANSNRYSVAEYSEEPKVGSRGRMIVDNKKEVSFYHTSSTAKYLGFYLGKGVKLGEDGVVRKLGKNLFNKNAELDVRNIYADDSGKFMSDNSPQGFTFPCEGGKTYTVSKTQSSQYFRVVSSANLPANGVSFSTKVASTDGKTATITTKAGDKWLFVRCWDFEQPFNRATLDELQIELGDKATPFEPLESKNILDLPMAYTIPKGQSVAFISQKIEAGSKFTFSVGNIETDSQNIKALWAFVGKDDKWLASGFFRNPNEAHTCDVSEEVARLFLYSFDSWAGSQNVTTTFHNLQIEYGDKATDYQPHNGTLVQSTDNLCSLKLKANGQLFLSSAKSAELTTIGTNWGNTQSQPVILYAGVKVAGDVYDSICLGSFVVDEQNVNLERGMTNFKLLDGIATLSNIEYSATEVAFPCTVRRFIEEMSALNGMTIGTDLAQLPNNTYTMQENLWEKINKSTYRSILDEFAGATASFVNLRGENNEIVFRQPQKTSQETLTYQNLKRVKFGAYYGNLNTVTLSRQPQEDNITVQNAELVAKDGVKQAKLANNEILDDDRQTLATPILNAVQGFGYYATEIETEGHLYYEIGDRLTITDGSQSWDTIVTDIEITLDGGIKEKLKCVAPAKAETNYSTTGSIYKSIWNTEIKVDKQNNEIVSIVSKQDQLGDKVDEQFTQIQQDLHSITSSVQTIGGGNIIKNSVGYAKNADGKLSFWNKPTGAVKAMTSPESISFGAISGNEIDIPSAGSIAQKVNVAVQEGALYTLTAFVKKPTVGDCQIRAYNEIDNFVIDIVDGTELLWEKVELIGFKPSMGYLVIELKNTDCANMAVTDLMLSLGDTSTAWQQAPSEILNTQVALTEDGVKVQSSVYAGDYVEITPLEFAGYSNAGGSTEKVFSLNRDTTQVSKINIEKQMFMNPIKVIPIKEGSQAGLAFVKSEEA